MAATRPLKTLVRESLLGLLSERSSLTHPSVPQLLRNVCEGCDLGIATFLRLARSSVFGGEEKVRKFLATRLKRITVKPFMDIHTMLEERLLQCCVHVGAQGEGGQHQCAPFCAMQAWVGLSETKLSARAGRRMFVVAAAPAGDDVT